MVIEPKYLGVDLFENLRLMLNQMYPKTFKNEGYIFNIKVDSIIDNKITSNGQIILYIKCSADLYVPQPGHTFQGILKKNVNNKFQWVEVPPLTIFLNESVEEGDNQVVSVRITDVKSDNTICRGVIV